MNEEEPIERMRRVFHKGLAPLATDKALKSLRKALADDDQRLLIGGVTTMPSCMMGYTEPDDPQPCLGACPIAWLGWQGEGLEFVFDVWQFFRHIIINMDGQTGENCCSRHITSWWDETPREQAVPLLLAEVDKEIARRKEARNGTTD